MWWARGGGEEVGEGVEGAGGGVGGFRDYDGGGEGARVGYSDQRLFHVDAWQGEEWLERGRDGKKK